MISIYAPFYVKEECTERFVSIARHLISETQKEDGCIAYDLYQDSGNPNIVAFVEIWKSQAVLDAHMQTPHFVEIVPQLEKFKQRPSDVIIMKRI
ncbi:putative quinol monooxygenase [Paenibacillus azoreducens]|uniref:putative quinol monooxygenase n=1 Tax=Paenibacillus azoreducens TaxID=116718 RepID=UPI0039F620C2